MYVQELRYEVIYLLLTIKQKHLDAHIFLAPGINETRAVKMTRSQESSTYNKSVRVWLKSITHQLAFSVKKRIISL